MSGRKIALLGSAGSSILAPSHDPEWEIWACSPNSMPAFRIDQHFELHRYEPGKEWFPPEYVQWLSECKGTVWMAEHVESIPMCQVLPWEELTERYGKYFFTSSIAWMMALAIEMEPEEISIYGVDMAAETEYEAQKLGCQFFATLAVAKGIKVTVPPESDLLRPNPLYGICEISHEWIKNLSKREEMEKQEDHLSKVARNAEVEARACRLALDVFGYYSKTWAGDMSSGDYTSPPPMPALEGIFDKSEPDDSP